MKLSTIIRIGSTFFSVLLVLASTTGSVFATPNRVVSTGTTIGSWPDNSGGGSRISANEFQESNPSYTWAHLEPLLEDASGDFGTAIAITGANASKWGVNGRAEVEASGYISGGFARAEAYSTEIVTASVPGLPAGTLTIWNCRVKFDGNVSGSAAFPPGALAYGTSRASLALRWSNILGLGSRSYTGAFDTQNPSAPNSIPFPSGEYVVPIVMANEGGSQIDFELRLDVYATTNGGGEAKMKASFEHTFEWIGVDSVTDQFGAPLSGYSLVDEDGESWLTGNYVAVPEPSGLMMFTIFAGLLRRKRR